MEQHKFHWADYLIFCLTLLFSLIIGIYFSFKKKSENTTNEYFTGSRKLHIIPVAVSILVTNVTAVGVIGYPAEVYSYGTIFLLFTLAQLTGTVVSAFTMVPLFYKLKLISVSQYPQVRFQSIVLRYIFSIVTLLCYAFINGILLYAPCIALQAVSSIPFPVAVVVAGGIGTLYTSLGGIKAVIWTDLFQCFIIVGGLVFVVIQGAIKVGGVERVWQLNKEWGRINIIDFDPDPTKRYTVWTVGVMNTVIWFSVAASQPTVQRFTAVSSLKKAKTALLMNAPGLAFATLLSSLTGIVAFAYYANEGCDPLKAKYIYSPNQILSYFVMDVLNYPGIPGVFIACIFSAALSTISSCVNSMAAFVFQDFIPERVKEKSQKTQTAIIKVIVALIGVVIIIIALLVQQIGGTIVQVAFSVAGITHGPLVGIIIIGATFPKVNKHGMIISFFVSLTFVSWLVAGAKISGINAPPLPSPVKDCQFEQVLSNVTFVNVYANQTDNSASQSDIMYVNGDWISKDNVTVITSQNYHTYLTGLDRIYAVSYCSYTAISLFLAMFVAVLLSFIPVFQEKRLIDENLLFPFVVAICNQRCGVQKERPTDAAELELKSKLEENHGNDENDNLKSKQNLNHISNIDNKTL